MVIGGSWLFWWAVFSFCDLSVSALIPYQLVITERPPPLHLNICLSVYHNTPTLWAYLCFSFWNIRGAFSSSRPLSELFFQKPRVFVAARWTGPSSRRNFANFKHKQILFNSQITISYLPHSASLTFTYWAKNSVEYFIKITDLLTIATYILIYHSDYLKYTNKQLNNVNKQK